jgi:hypothetical protein
MTFQSTSVSNSFIVSVVEKLVIPNITKLVVVTHLVAGTDSFLTAVHRILPIAVVIPKPNSIDPNVLASIGRSIPILPFTRDKIKENPRGFVRQIHSNVGDSDFAIVDTGGVFFSRADGGQYGTENRENSGNVNVNWRF